MATSLAGRICLVTGASRGIGRGIALQLGSAGATVYITGRSLDARPGEVGGSLRQTAEEISKRGGTGIPITCDHSIDDDVKNLFKRISEEQNGRFDVLVNNAYTAVNAISNAQGKPFWEQGLEMWDIVNNVGLRNHYICTVLASQMMVPRQSGLIVNVSSPGGLRYLFNVAYGIGKQALDRMSVDTAIELKKHNVACISLWPGAVKTELVESKILGDNESSDLKRAETARIFENAETIEYVGKAVVALASDSNVISRSGRIWMTGDLGQIYGFRDEGDRIIASTRSVKNFLRMSGYHRLSRLFPYWIKLPGWLFSMAGNKL